LMLDEVADLPLPMQVKLLRAIQERRVRKVGSTVEEPVDVRLISATHQNLAACVEAGRFRQDLYYRLNVIELSLPPLRERKDDIGLLAGAVLQRLSGAARMQLSPHALQALCEHSFPGNVRELENILERALAFASGDTIDAQDLALKPLAATAPAPAPTPTLPAGEPVVIAPEPAVGTERAPAPPAAAPGSLPQQLDKPDAKAADP
ncbi:MAG: sigma-54-dependent Fis family transcriptional regulator, partial [Oxalobacteraceae bacterium]